MVTRAKKKPRRRTDGASRGMSAVAWGRGPADGFDHTISGVAGNGGKFTLPYPVEARLHRFQRVLCLAEDTSQGIALILQELKHGE